MNIKALYPKIKNNIEIYGISNNPYEVKTDYIFVLTSSTKNDHLNIKKAIKNGACLIISNKHRSTSVLHIKSNNPKKEYLRLLKLFYHYSPIYTVGVIGNSGKTVTTELLNNIFAKLNPAACITDNKIKYNTRCYKTNNYMNFLYPSFKVFNNNEIKNVSINIDNDTIINNEVLHLDLNGIIFTNFEYRNSIKDKKLTNYFHTNHIFFNNLNHQTLLIMNSDDIHSKFIPKYSKNKILTYGIKTGIYNARNIKLGLEKTEFDVYYKNIYLTNIIMPLFGKSNVYNALGVIAYTCELGIPLEIIKGGIESINISNYNYSILNTKIIKEISLNLIKPNIFKQALLDLKKLNNKKIISIIPSNINLEKNEKIDLGVLSTVYSNITIFTCSNNFESLSYLISNLTNYNYYICPNIEESYKLAYSLYNENDIILNIN